MHMSRAFQSTTSKCSATTSFFTYNDQNSSNFEADHPHQLVPSFGYRDLQCSDEKIGPLPFPFWWHKNIHHFFGPYNFTCNHCHHVNQFHLIIEIPTGKSYMHTFIGENTVQMLVTMKEEHAYNQ